MEKELTFMQKLGRWNDLFWNKWENRWSKIFRWYDSKCEKFNQQVEKIRDWDNKNCQKMQSFFPNQQYCDGCCNPKHWNPKVVK